jgi:hypothetical protein
MMAVLYGADDRGSHHRSLRQPTPAAPAARAGTCPLGSGRIGSGPAEDPDDSRRFAWHDRCEGIVATNRREEDTMSHAGAIREQHTADETWDDDEPISGVFAVAYLLSFDIAVGTLHHLEADHEPAPVYALPFTMMGRQRVPYPQRYYLGTRFVTGLIAAEDWEDEMRRDGLPEAMIVKAACYVEARAL